jgi:hypothetical protein
MQDTEINELAERYRTLLTQDDRKIGKAMADDGGNLEFMVTIDEVSILFLFAKNDAQYVRIVLPNFCALERDDEIVNALVAMNHVNALCKVAKVNLTDRQDNVVACVEYLDHGTSANKVQLERYLAMLVNTAREFSKKMLALKSGDDAPAA